MVEVAVEELPDAVYERAISEVFGDHAGPWIAEESARRDGPEKRRR